MSPREVAERWQVHGPALPLARTLPRVRAHGIGHEATPPVLAHASEVSLLLHTLPSHSTRRTTCTFILAAPQHLHAHPRSLPETSRAVCTRHTGARGAVRLGGRRRRQMARRDPPPPGLGAAHGRERAFSSSSSPPGLGAAHGRERAFSSSSSPPTRALYASLFRRYATNWTTGGDVCRWWGVTCSKEVWEGGRRHSTQHCGPLRRAHGHCFVASRWRRAAAAR